MRTRITTLMIALGFLLTLVPASAAPAPTDGRKTFTTPDAAVNALVDAVSKDDTATMMALFGPQGKEIVTSGDPVADRINRKKFAEMAAKQCHLVVLDKDWAVAKIGSEGWMFPVPIVKAGMKWYFDTAAGKQELLDERIGRNELHTIGVCHAFVDAQFDYHAGDYTGRGPEYAQKIRSTAGKKDGLYWPTAEGQKPSPLGPIFAGATTEGYDLKKSGPVPFHGYFYRVLEFQGDHVAGGAKPYVKDGRMTEGFALIAWPASYGTSGVMTFLIDSTGIVWQKDLGKQTASVVRSITSFDPDKTWAPTAP